MAILHQAQLTPSKPEMLRALLESRPWGEAGEPQVLGAYRFDDPAGEVGVECHLVQLCETVYHLPLTYRSAPLGDAEGAAEALVGTMEHSVLGQRFVYDGLQDEVALDCFRRALSGEQEQARIEVVDAEGRTVEHREPTVTLALEVDEGEVPPSAEELLDGAPFTIARTLGDLDGTVRLVARWDGGSAAVAAF
ncbi:hypothetical protein [Brachybacterium sp. YJGR34]|uniref:maltokinase N-terminal cap-like domain-containing protein n=1 Tax=Brachybacterium sp. YJGR34 TaxID=2059911 RepID=UPI000E0B3731|nr:hypothetical protein [Brachybacterium sp. YJGR34]